MRVDWYDATDRTEISLDEIMKSPTKKFLTKRTSYGKVIKEDSFGVILLTDKDQDDLCEITTIPKKWIIRKDNER